MWRPMTQADLPTVTDIAAVVHPSLPEDTGVFAERLKLYPDGCYIFERRHVIEGYIVSHPWTEQPPALNSLLGEIPAAPTTYYFHDLALLPSARNSGAGGTIVDQLIAHARHLGLATASLVAVNDSGVFWHKLGFRDRTDGRMRDKLKSYGTDAIYMRVRLSL